LLDWLCSSLSRATSSQPSNRKANNMTKFDFYALCGKYLIDVDIALESEELRELLRNKANTETIENFLKEQF
tara:strand:- start:552 stop:767 length:216 start_codon:yes stop_codon:yes gene_type:complete